MADLRIMERAVPWTHLCFRDGVTEVSLTFMKDLMRRKDKRATLGSVADNFFGGRYRSSGTVVLRLSPEACTARAANPFVFGVERMLGDTETEACIYESRSCRPKQDAMVRLADCADNAAGYELWKAAWRRANELKQSLAATGEGQRQPVEDVPLSPVDDDDVILYAPLETSRGVRGDTYGWIPDTCCGVYHIEGGTESDYTDNGSAQLVVAKGGMSDENRLRDRVSEQCSKSNLGFYVKHDGRKPRVRYVAIFPQSIVEEAEKDYLRRLQRLKLGFQFTDALDKTKVELFSYVPSQVLLARDQMLAVVKKYHGIRAVPTSEIRAVPEIRAVCPVPESQQEVEPEADPPDPVMTCMADCMDEEDFMAAMSRFSYPQLRATVDSCAPWVRGQARIDFIAALWDLWKSKQPQDGPPHRRRLLE